MRVDRRTAVVICQDYGFKMADNWPDAKLARKLGEIMELFRSGEYEPDDEELYERLSEMVDKMDDKGIELFGADSKEDQDIEQEANEEVQEKGMDDSQEEEQSESAGSHPLCIGDRVLVKDDPRGRPWRAEVVRIINDRAVEVRDENGQLWGVNVGHCKVIARRKQDKNLLREEIAGLILKERPEGVSIDELVNEVEDRFVQQGGKPRMFWTRTVVKRFVRACVFLGLFRLEGGIVSWAASK